MKDFRNAPVGTVVDLATDKLASADFQRYLFNYFEELTSGQTGWGIDFISWLKISKGWKHLGLRKFERECSEEDLSDDFDKFFDLAGFKRKKGE